MEVVFKGPIASHRFGGTFTMQKDMKELLSYLEQISHLIFKVEERRIIVEEKNNL
ncbi:hypothetical protein SAMN05216436_12177 [bacterium A37T11]|nr:hypothetical protein SAMN05216436_12177 [bacterium A37T11]